MPGPPLPVITAASDSAASLPGWAQQASAWIPLAGAATGVLALVVALAAAWYAKGQLGHARKLAVEQAQPYVVLSAQPTESDPDFVELVLRNYGATGAHDVHLASDPPLWQSASAGTTSEPVRLPESWPFLAPGQEWRTGWDGTYSRELVGGLADRHEVTVTYRDSKNRPLSTQAVLDFALHRQRDWTVETSPAKARRAQVDTAAELQALVALAKRRRTGTGAEASAASPPDPAAQPVITRLRRALRAATASWRERGA